ncbi:MAG: TolC family outer membrane protein [Rhizobiales bacterium]|nr:TolC family outer membrane protein [Hyphomicrobiales bacterium]
MHQLARFLLCGFMAISLSAPAFAMSLREAAQKAVSTHPGIGAARAAGRASIWDFQASKARLLPNLDVSADAGAQYVDQPNNLTPKENAEWNFRRQAAAEATQFLFDGWDRANDIYRSAALVGAASMRVMERSEALALEAVEAYIDVERHSLVLGLANQSRKRLQGILGLVRELNTGGKVPRSDVDQAVERIAASDAVIAQIEQSLADAKAKFRQVVGNEPGRLERVAYPKNIPASRDSAYGTAKANNPAIKALEAQAAAAHYEMERAKSGYYPELSLRGRASYGYDIDGVEGKDVDVTGVVGLEWNLFNGGATGYRVAALNEEAARAELERDAAIRSVRESIDKAFAAYVIGKKRVAAAQQQVDSNDRLVKQYREEYRLAKRSLLDLLDSETALFSSQFQLASAKAARLFSAYNIHASTGRLLATLGVQAPPEAHVDIPNPRQTGGILNFNIEPLRQD